MHKSQKILADELKSAKDSVFVGRNYSHYKKPDRIYTVLHLAFNESNEEICVIYQAQYDEKIIFIRPLINWLEQVEWNGEVVNRFNLLD